MGLTRAAGALKTERCMRIQEVRECASFLDTVAPGWAYKVDMRCLNFSSNYMCVVGQIWGSIYKAEHWPIIASQWPSAVTGGLPYWEEEIEARRAKPLVVPEEWTKPREPVVVG